uniref:Ig-like domain-containing protein n=1 Tax=Echeneis naucrates TaxID=173247 RepID=A0A665UVQ1_ECHNA
MFSENPCRLTFEKPTLTAPGPISLTCSTSNLCPSDPQIQDLTQIPPKPFTTPNSSQGESVTLTCSAKGNPEPQISWFKGETQLSSEAKWTITSINDSQSGEYYCKAENTHGIVRSEPVFINVTCE